MGWDVSTIMAHVSFILEDDILLGKRMFSNQLDLGTKIKESTQNFIVLSWQGRLEWFFALFKFDIVNKFASNHCQQICIFISCILSTAQFDQLGEDLFNALHRVIVCINIENSSSKLSSLLFWKSLMLEKPLIGLFNFF